MKSDELAKILGDWLTPVITFNEKVSELESSISAGMRGRLTGVVYSDFGADSYYKFQVDLTEFEDFNRPLEEHDFYDKNGNPCLTAREAGVYESIEDIYLDPCQEVPWSIEEDFRLALHLRYMSEAQEKTYVQWLEDTVNALTQVDSAHRPDILNLERPK